VAIALFVRQDTSAIFDLVIAAGPGLIVAGLFHAAPTALNARAWQFLLPRATRPALGAMSRLVWVRESINSLLPVGRIGGELVAYRLLRRMGVRRASAAASLVVDMALSVVSQAVFALLGLGLLIAIDRSRSLVTELSAAVIVMLLLGFAFVGAQRAGAFEALTRVLDRFAAGRLGGFIAHSARIDRAARSLYQRGDSILACFVWQLAAWLGGAVEIWLALFFLGHPVEGRDAVLIEALIQAISSAAFIVPGALGVQEGSFLIVGAVLGLDTTIALALAAARRLRDLIFFVPGLVAWWRLEARRQSATRK
jgi:glycosyltransferase 2 family protein